MIASLQDVLIWSEEDFEQLPDEGFWEVVQGRPIQLPPPEYNHQGISLQLAMMFSEQLRRIGFGHVVQMVNVSIPPREGFPLQSRVPDLLVSRTRPARRFGLGTPPDLVIEILSTRRGNVERTGKMDDYARAGIGEYWIVNPFAREVEVYRLSGNVYARIETAPGEPLRPFAFPGVEISVDNIWQ